LIDTPDGGVIQLYIIEETRLFVTQLHALWVKPFQSHQYLKQE